MALMDAFQWGLGGKKLSPAEVAARRQVANSIVGRRGVAKNLGEGLASVGDALLYNSNISKAQRAEEEGRAAAAEVFKAMQSGSTDPMTAIADPWLQEDPGMSAVAQAMLGQKMKADDPAYQLDMAYKQAQIDALGQKSAPGAPETKEVYDPETGRKQVMQWDPTMGDWAPLGGIAAPSDALVQVNTGDNSGAFLKKADEKAAERYDTIISGGNDAANFVGDLNALAEIGKNLNTGKGAEITAALGPYAEFLGIDVRGLDEAQAFDAIVSRMAPQMRVPGSGASSDFDAKQFLKSLPGLGKTPEGNAIIIETFRAVQERKIAAAEIAQRVMSGEMTWQQGDAEIAALGDPFTAFNDYTASAGAQPVPTISQPTAVNPTTGEKVVWDGAAWVPAR